MLTAAAGRRAAAHLQAGKINRKNKPNCRQNKDGKDRRAIMEKLEKAGLLNSIDPTSIRNAREGITFNITDRAVFLATINSNRAFAHNTPFGAEHAGQVGSNIVTVKDFRSFTSGTNTLGVDSVSGVTRSLQVDVGSDRGQINAALGYADLDCDNPAQDVNSFVRHAAHIVFNWFR